MIIKKFISLWLGLLLNLLSTQSAIAELEPTSQKTSNQFKVGVILPLSGKVAEYGQAMQNGIELLLKDKQDDRERIRFYYEDVQYSPQAAVGAFNKLRTIDKVDLIYSFGVDLSKSVAPLAERYKFPLVAQSVDQTISRNAKYVIRFSNDTAQYAAKLLEYTRAKDIKRIAVVDAHNAYITETLASLNRLKVSGEEISIVNSFELRDTDFRSTISKLSRGQYDAIAVFLGAGQISRFYKQLKEQNVKLPTIGTNWFESTSEIRDSGGSMNGAVFSNNVVKNEFANQYLQEYGSDSQITFAAYAYEFADIIHEHFPSKDSQTNESIIAKLTNVKPRTGTAIGPIYFQESQHTGKAFQFPIANKIIFDNQIRLVDDNSQQIKTSAQEPDAPAQSLHLGIHSQLYQ